MKSVIASWFNETTEAGNKAEVIYTVYQWTCKEIILPISNPSFNPSSKESRIFLDQKTKASPLLSIIEGEKNLQFQLMTEILQVSRVYYALCYDV